MKRIVYVDFENVSSAGLAGVLKLGKNDEVKIFLGPKCSKMSLIEAESILHCDATVELIKNDQIGKNALDFIIMVHLGYDIAKSAGDRFFIISNDKGYEPAIHEMQSMTGEVIERYPDIEHVIARKEEKTGFFAKLFGKKPTVVENTTEHEVLSKRGRNTRSQSGSHTTNGRPQATAHADGGARGGNRNGNRADGSRNGYRADNRSSANSGRRDWKGGNNYGNVRANSGQNGNASVTGAKAEEAKRAAEAKAKEAAQKKAEEAKKAAEVRAKEAAQKKAEEAKKAAEARKAEAVKASVDDSYLDDLSIADLRTKLNVKKESGSQGERASSGQTAKAADSQSVKPAAQASKTTETQVSKAPAKPAARTEMTDTERDLVNRALAETDNLGDFHNYILKELRDNDRATEIYKAEKHKVGKKNSD